MGVSFVAERLGFPGPAGCNEVERHLGNRTYNSEVGNSMGGWSGDASESFSFRNGTKHYGT